MTMATQMTRAEFYAKYGDVEVTFSSYYKFTFTYAATLPDGKRQSYALLAEQEARGRRLIVGSPTGIAHPSWNKDAQ
jgi:hypothetical protein